MNFADFSSSYHNKDIGLRRAVALALTQYRDLRKFSSNVIDRSDKYREIFLEVDRHEFGQPHKFVTAHRERKGFDWANRVDTWKRDPWKRPKPHSDIDAVTVFYYFTHVLKDENGEPVETLQENRTGQSV